MSGQKDERVCCQTGAESSGTLVDPVRQEVLALAHTVVIKVGTQVVTDDSGRLCPERLAGLVEQIERLRAEGRRVALVSSGAIGAGVGRLGLARRPESLRHLQAAASVGQTELMRCYAELFARHGTQVGQLLLTAADFDNRTRYLNVRNTLWTLFEWRCLPIVNENDTVSVAEIRFGDNDRLAAMVTNLLQAPLLILLSTVDGLLCSDAQTGQEHPLLTVERFDDSLLALAREQRTRLGSGGMKSKLQAARLVTRAGECALIANGCRPGILDEIRAGKPVGTLFLPQGGLLPARKRWLGLTARPRGSLRVDAGACAALSSQGKSLLPIGVIGVEGHFNKGDVVSVLDPEGHEFARGLVNYSAADVRRIMGLRSERVLDRLGPGAYEEVIHRDNLVLLDDAPASDAEGDEEKP